jgi:stage II sporulation protein AA (anti-sigma F factor antagonist)
VIDFSIKGQTLVVRIGGEMDLAVAEYIRQEIDRRFSREGAKNILLDLKGVTFMDSSGLGVVLGRYKKVAAIGGRMAIIHVAPQVKRVLDVAGVNKLMDYFRSEQQALAEL